MQQNVLLNCIGTLERHTVRIDTDNTRLRERVSHGVKSLQTVGQGCLSVAEMEALSRLSAYAQQCKVISDALHDRITHRGYSHKPKPLSPKSPFNLDQLRGYLMLEINPSQVSQQHKEFLDKIDLEDLYQIIAFLDGTFRGLSSVRLEERFRVIKRVLEDRRDKNAFPRDERFLMEINHVIQRGDL